MPLSDYNQTPSKDYTPERQIPFLNSHSNPVQLCLLDDDYARWMAAPMYPFMRVYVLPGTRVKLLVLRDGLDKDHVLVGVFQEFRGSTVDGIKHWLSKNFDSWPHMIKVKVVDWLSGLLVR